MNFTELNTIKQFVRTIETIRYLKPSQVFYRVKYILSPVRKLNRHYFSGDICHSFSLTGLPEQKNIVSHREGTFSVDILNLKKTYPSGINWADLEYGRLWNYNLQYADFLNQSNLPITPRKELLFDLYNWLFDGRIAPEPYPSSLRIMNMIRFHHSLYESPENEPALLDIIYSELRFLSGRFEYHLSGNHLLENAFALLMGGSYLRNQKWVDKAEKVLMIELSEQILDDGAHYERSPMYHRIILFRILEAVSYTDTASEFHLMLKNFAEKMISWMQKIAFRNRKLPNLNDSSDGVAFSATSLIGIAKDLKLDTELDLPLQSSGFRIFKTRSLECLIDVEGIKPDHQPGHAHADSLSFLLHINGEPVIIDPGTSTYDNNLRRQWERSTVAHNTITRHEENTADVWHSFRVGKRPDVKIIEETETTVYAELSCKIEGNVTFIHKRRFTKADDMLVIEDETDYAGRVTGRLYFAPGIQITIQSDGLDIQKDSIEAHIRFGNADKVTAFDYENALGFNKTAKSTGIAYQFKNHCRMSISGIKT